MRCDSPLLINSLSSVSYYFLFYMSYCIQSSFYCPFQTRRSTPKSRLFTTLDPELMLHPEGLPRASTVSMTKEYSFLRTSVPRGPKLGSLGIPSSKENKSKSSRSNKIHSLADYRTPESDAKSTDASTSGLVSASADSSFSSLHSTISSVSTVSEISSETNTHLQSSQLIIDNISEVDGSESGFKADGNDSDSSSYSSMSTTGTYNMLAALVNRPKAPYTVEGREIAPEAMGHFPSLQEVLQAATDERHMIELEQDREGSVEPRSRRDSFSSRYE